MPRLAPRIVLLVAALFAAAPVWAAEPPLPASTPGAPPVRESFVEVPYEGTTVSLGPSVGGGLLVGMTMELRLSRTLWFQTDLGVRPGLSVSSFYPNVAMSAGINLGLGEGRTRHGVFAVAGASAPIGFFDAWIASGWCMEVFNKKGRRAMSLELGPSLYLVRMMPLETNLTWPVFLYARAAWPIELGGQVRPKATSTSARSSASLAAASSR